jgi:hypothetical protein
MSFSGPEKRKRLVWSMVTLAGVVIAAGLGTNAITGYLKSRDPIYQCIKDPSSQPFQISVPISVTQDGANMSVPAGIGISSDCTRPVHTLEPNVIHVAYGSAYNFTLGHFLYIWNIDLSKYQTKVYVDGSPYTQGSFLNLVLKSGQSIQIEFNKR